MATLKEVDFDPFAGEAPKSRIDSALQAEGITGAKADFVKSIYQQESGSGKNTKTSNAGAVGGMQIIPATFNSVADKGWSIDNPDHNARAGVRYASQGFDAAGGDPALGGAYYYGGPGGMRKAAQGIAVSDPRNPNAPTTLQYGQQVASRMPAQSTQPVAKNYKLTEVDFDPFAPAQPVAKPVEQGTGSELLRQGGLTLRAGVNSLVALPAMAADAASGVVNTGLDLVAGKNNGFRFQQTGPALNRLMTSAGVPEPQNATERVVQDLGSSMGGAGVSVGVGKFLARNAAPVVQSVGNMLSTGPGMQTAAAVTSAGASGITRENGGSGTAQMVAGLGGALAPSAAVAGGSMAVRGLLRGGEEGRQTVNNNIKLFQDAAGVSPSVGQATESRANRAVESLLAKTPGSAGVMQRSAQGKADAMGNSIRQTADELAPNASAINAGESIEKGVQGFKEGFKKVQERLYTTLDKHIAPDAAIPVGNTEFKLKELNAGIDGAPNLSQFFKNSKIQGIDKALQADLEQSASGGHLPYEAVKKLRTLIGNEIADNSLLSDVPRSKWTALYGSLSDDLGIAAKQAGPKAEQSWQWANQYTKGQLTRLEDLSKIVGKDSPEKIFNAAMAGTAEGNTILKRVVDAIPKENRKELAAAVLKRMGQATNGNQNAVGDVFSSETFLTNINKLSPEARSTLFGRLGVPDAPEKLNKLAEMAANMREGSKVFANPSGTGQAINLQQSGGGAALLSMLLGHPAVAAGITGSMAGSNLLAKKMTDGNFVNWLGQSTKLSPSVSASEVNALSQYMNR